MTIKAWFINPEEARLRAGWRIVVFLLALSAVMAVLMVVIRTVTGSGVLLSKLTSEFLTYAAVFGVSWGMLAWIDRRPLRAIGLGLHERTLTELVQGIVLGAVMMGVIFVVTLVLGMSEFQLKPLTLAQALSMTSFSLAEFTVVAIGEELLFRGYLFQTLAEGTSRLIAVIAFSLFFGFVHKSNPNATTFSLINIAIAGVWLSAAYVKTRGLWLPIGLHFSWNFFQNHVFSFPVSGLQMSDTQLGVLRDRGPEWITGGAFGPEGGALATLVIVAGTVLIWYAPMFKASPSAWMKPAAFAVPDGGDDPTAPGELAEGGSSQE